MIVLFYKGGQTIYEVKKWTSLIVLITFFISIGNVNIVKAVETSVSSTEDKQNVVTISESGSEDVLSEITTTTSSAAELITTSEKQEGNTDLTGLSVKSTTETYVNPMYQDLDVSSAITSTFSNSSVLAGTESQTFATIKDAGVYMRQEMIKFMKEKMELDMQILIGMIQTHMDQRLQLSIN